MDVNVEPCPKCSERRGYLFSSTRTCLACGVDTDAEKLRAALAASEAAREELAGEERAIHLEADKAGVPRNAPSRFSPHGYGLATALQGVPDAGADRGRVIDFDLEQLIDRARRGEPIIEATAAARNAAERAPGP